MEPQIKALALAAITDREGRRDWSALPPSFEVDAVRSVFQRIKPMFPRRAIRARIAASKATTFTDLRAAIEAA